MIRRRELDLITYRAPLALHFTDAVTNQPIGEGLRVFGWPLVANNSQPVHQIVEAEKSMKSAIYGFRTLPGLERYQRGDDSDVIRLGTQEYVVQIEDRRGRFLPQTRRFELPLDEPAVQEIILYPAPTRPTPPGYTTIHGDIYLTTSSTSADSEVSVIGPASWAQITLALAIINMTESDSTLSADGQGRIGGMSPLPTIPTEELLSEFSDMTEPDPIFFADGQGRFVGMVPLPTVPAEKLLYAASWNVTVSIKHNALAIEDDLKKIMMARPDLDPAQTPPFQATLEPGDPDFATIIGTVTVDDSTDQIIYSIVPTEPPFTYKFGKPLVIRTHIEGAENHLSELLIHS